MVIIVAILVEGLVSETIGFDVANMFCPGSSFSISSLLNILKPVFVFSFGENIQESVLGESIIIIPGMQPDDKQDRFFEGKDPNITGRTDRQAAAGAVEPGEREVPPPCPF